MISKFIEFINESQTVVLDNGQGGNVFKTNKYGNKSIGHLNGVIKKFIESVYGTFGFIYGVNSDINVNGKIINGEYISKMVNNYTIFKSIIRLNNLKDEDSFYSFVMSNLNDIYAPDGKFFEEQTLPILINTTRKGNLLEKMAKESFLAYAKSKNIDITIQNPSIEEDISGIDFIFINNNKRYTVQVKPFNSYKFVGDNIYIKSNGSLSLDTNYLILCDGNNCIKLKNTKSTQLE